MGQGIAGDREVADPLVRGQLRVDLGDGVPRGPDCVRPPRPLDRLGRGQHEADQPALPLQERELPDEGMAENDRLHVLGVNVLAAFRDQHLVDASGDVEKALGVEIAQVPGAEPPVGGEGLPGLLREVEVAGEDAGAPSLDLPFAGRAALQGVDA